MHPVVLSGNGEIAVRLGAALILGSALGLNRELHGKPAGLRTHGLVSLGAAVAVIVSLGFPGDSKSIDPNAVSRVLQGILTGIGFLGAGVNSARSQWSRHRPYHRRDHLDLRRARGCLRAGLLVGSRNCGWPNRNRAGLR